uniref:Uncharacterized protein n=1 Tax=Arabidopsis thaliana TaxID=3702 RepID=Q8L8U4_ARATH|nr:unknown [Arabidopsis thaliana]
MTTIAAAGLNVATPRVVVRPVARVLGPVRLNYPWKFGSMKRMVVVKATSEGEISEKVEKSIAMIILRLMSVVLMIIKKYVFDVRIMKL